MPTHAIATTGEQVDPTTGELNGYMTKYKSYSFFLNQSGTDAPVATTLCNSFSAEPVWERYVQGTFFLKLPGEFIAGKTAVISGVFPGGFVGFDPGATENEIVIYSYDANVAPQDGWFMNTFIEVRVYE